MSDALVLDAGCVVEAIAGENVSGDVARVDRLADGRLRLMLADGLGHGPAAADAANQCVMTLAQDPDATLADAFRNAHRALRGSRGAVAAAATVDGASRALHVSILGNISVRVVGTRDSRVRSTSAVGVPGVLGSLFHEVPVQRFDIHPGDVIVLHSDGIRSHFETLQARAIDAQSAAAEIVARHGRGRDDASCIVVRVLPPSTVLGPSAALAAPAGEPGKQISLRRIEDIQVAATTARAFAAQLGLPGRAQWEVGIAAAELAQNVVKYGVEGLLSLRADGEQGLVLEVVDRGPGFGAAEPQPGLREGLGAVRRMMDSCDVHTSPIGTRVIARKALPAR